MSEGMSAQTAPAPVVLDFDHVYELGRLSGEVRLLKWAVAAAFVAILGCMGVLYDAIKDVQVELVEMRKDISGLRNDMTGVQRDLAAIDARVVTIEEDMADLKRDVSDLKIDVSELKIDVSDLRADVSDLRADVSDLKKMHSSLPVDAHGLHGNLRDFPGHADPAGESIPPASATPPA